MARVSKSVDCYFASSYFLLEASNFVESSGESAKRDCLYFPLLMFLLFFFFFLSLVEQLRWEDVNETKQDLALFSPIDVFTIKSCGGAIIRTGSRKDLQLDSLKCLFIAARFMHFEIEGSSCSSSCIRVSNFDECRFYRWVWSEFLNLLERWMKRRKISRLSNVFCTLYVSLFHQFKIFLEYLCTCINTRGRYAATNKNFNTIW